MGVWNSSKQTVHDIIPVFRLLSLLRRKQKKLTQPTSSIQKDQTSNVSSNMDDSLHFDIAGLLVVAEGTRELTFQVPCHFLLRRRLSFGLTTTHCAN